MGKGKDFWRGICNSGPVYSTPVGAGQSVVGVGLGEAPWKLSKSCVCAQGSGIRARGSAVAVVMTNEQRQ